MSKNRKTYFILLIATLFLVEENAFASTKALPPQIQPYKCAVVVDNPHISTSQYELGLGSYVKVNARAKCDVPMSRVTLTVQLWEKGKFLPVFLTSTTTDPLKPKSHGFEVRNYETLVFCTNQKRTLYFGRAHAGAVINGQYQTTAWARSFTVSIRNCGT